MTPGEYEIAVFRPEHLDGVLDVLRGIWPYDRETLARFFHWRHVENPYTDAVRGIVALHRGKPVGFRGYMAGRFTADAAGMDVDVLYACDTVVSPEHRNQGLSTSMGKSASEFGKAGYRAFLNLTNSANSRPGYRSLGFQPFGKRVLLLRDGWNPLRWAVCALSKDQFNTGGAYAPGRMRFGRAGDVLATEAPRPAEMAAIIAADKPEPGVLHVKQDAAFFAWRYRNPVRRYAFYYQMEGETECAYLVLGISPDARTARILDYGEAREGALRRILRQVCNRREFMALSTFGYGVDARLRRILDELRFIPVHTPRSLFKRGSVEALAPPILFRPVGESTADELRMGALDLRNPEHWQLKPICSDGA
jgi:hypothetical protein